MKASFVLRTSKRQHLEISLCVTLTGKAVHNELQKLQVTPPQSQGRQQMTKLR